MEEPYFYEGYELSEQVMVSFRSLDRKSQFQGWIEEKRERTDTENISNQMEHCGKDGVHYL